MTKWTNIKMLIQSVLCIWSSRIGRRGQDIVEAADNDDIRRMSTTYIYLILSSFRKIEAVEALTCAFGMVSVYRATPKGRNGG